MARDMKPGQTINVRLIAQSGEPLQVPNAFVRVQLFTNGQFRYSFTCGPTDGQGRLDITFAELEQQRIASATESLMDYNTKLELCDDRVKLSLPSKAELDAASQIATRWAGDGNAPPYAREWSASSNGQLKAEDVSAELHGDENIVPMACTVAE